MINYRKMFFSNKHGLFGTFQLPINVIAVVLLIVNIGIITFDSLNRFVEFALRSFTIPGYFITQMTSFPTLQELILARNIQVYLPIAIAMALGIYLIYFAHRLFKENFRKQIAPLISYMLIMPYFSTVNWVSSIYQEVSKSKRKW